MPTSAHDTQTNTVLKGVVRVENLSTPSEHIPALLERVKPIYISRTYNVPLPNKDDPSQGWETEDLLDKLARMKGRLLKHGEPDMDSVAKILLSDWVRGRIPFFVAPPERSEDLNRAEEKERKKAKSKNGKGKGREEIEVPGVKQNLGSIMQKNTFVAEDVRPLDEEFANEVNEEVESAGSDGGEEEAGQGEEELTWNDVFEGIKPDDAEDAEEDAVADQGTGYTCVSLTFLLIAV